MSRPNPLITTPQLAELCGVSRDWLYKQAQAGMLPHYKCGRKVKWDYQEVLSALAAPKESRHDKAD